MPARNRTAHTSLATTTMGTENLRERRSGAAQTQAVPYLGQRLPCWSSHLRRDAGQLQAAQRAIAGSARTDKLLSTEPRDQAPLQSEKGSVEQEFLKLSGKEKERRDQLLSSSPSVTTGGANRKQGHGHHSPSHSTHRQPSVCKPELAAA